MTIKIPEWFIALFIAGCMLFGLYSMACAMSEDSQTRPWHVVFLCVACDEELVYTDGCCPYCAEYPIDVTKRLKRSFFECTFLANCFTKPTIEWKECEDVDSK